MSYKNNAPAGGEGTNIGEAMPDKDTIIAPQFDPELLGEAAAPITPADIAEEAAAVVQSFRPTPHSEILDRLLDSIEKVDFRSLAELEEGEKLTQKHLLVHAVERVLEYAAANGWSICRRDAFIYLYNGAYWKELSPADLRTFLGMAAEKMGIEKHEARFYQFRQKLLEQFLETANLPSPRPPENTVFINLQNGTFEIGPTRRELREPRKEDFLRYQLPFAYDPAAAAPTFRRYLDTVLPDPDCQSVLAEFVAYAFIPHDFLKLEKALLLYGTGANGKSVFFQIVLALLGENNVSSYSLQSLTDANGYNRAAIANRLVNFASELSGKIETSYFKQLVSGEAVEARLPYGQPFILTNPAKLIFNANDLPRDVEHSHAYFRRFLIVPFTQTIPEEQQDKRLAQKIIKTELPGVLNWALEGLKRLLSNHAFTAAEAVRRAVEDYKVSSDSVKLFLSEVGYKPDALGFILIRDLYNEYKQFCMDDGYRPTGKTKFIQRLKDDGTHFERRAIGYVAFLQKTAPDAGL